MEITGALIENTLIFKCPCECEREEKSKIAAQKQFIQKPGQNDVDFC